MLQPPGVCDGGTPQSPLGPVPPAPVCTERSVVFDVRQLFFKLSHWSRLDLYLLICRIAIILEAVSKGM